MDTEPVVGSEEVIEETFVSAICDLDGWTRRGKELDRECNWALVGFSSQFWLLECLADVFGQVEFIAS